MTCYAVIDTNVTCYAVIDTNVTRYGDILKDNGLEWDSESMENADVSNLNAQCVLALIMEVA